MSSDGAAPLVRCRDLGRTYPGHSPVEALRAVTFDVAAGEQVAICGPSGSGKSTLMNLLGLLDAPTAGRYELEGKDVSSLPERSRAGLRATLLGFVFQSFHLLPGRTATHNVALGLLYTGVGRRSRLEQAREALTLVGIAHRADADVTQLSGGERQRAAIARAIVHRPRLLLADEPTGNLDSKSSGRILDLLEQLREGGLTQLVVTHDPEVAKRASRVLDVHDGQLTEEAV